MTKETPKLTANELRKNLGNEEEQLAAETKQLVADALHDGLTDDEIFDLGLFSDKNECVAFIAEIKKREEQSKIKEQKIAEVRERFAKEKAVLMERYKEALKKEILMKNAVYEDLYERGDKPNSVGSSLKEERAEYFIPHITNAINQYKADLKEDGVGKAKAQYLNNKITQYTEALAYIKSVVAKYDSGKPGLRQSVHIEQPFVEEPVVAGDDIDVRDFLEPGDINSDLVELLGADNVNAAVNAMNAQLKEAGENRDPKGELVEFNKEGNEDELVIPEEEKPNTAQSETQPLLERHPEIPFLAQRITTLKENLMKLEYGTDQTDKNIRLNPDGSFKDAGYYKENGEWESMGIYGPQALKNYEEYQYPEIKKRFDYETSALKILTSPLIDKIVALIGKLGGTEQFIKTLEGSIENPSERYAALGPLHYVERDLARWILDDEKRLPAIEKIIDAELAKFENNENDSNTVGSELEIKKPNEMKLTLKELETEIKANINQLLDRIKEKQPQILKMVLKPSRTGFVIDGIVKINKTGNFLKPTVTINLSLPLESDAQGLQLGSNYMIEAGVATGAVKEQLEPLITQIVPNIKAYFEQKFSKSIDTMNIEDGELALHFKE